MAVEVTEETAMMDAAVDHYLSNTEINNSGVRVVPKKVFDERLEVHGVSPADLKKVQDAINYETTAAARVALADTENKIQGASKADRESEEWRKACSSMVRLPTPGGATEVEVYAEKHSNVPARGDVPASVKVTHGRVRTTINTKSRIDKIFHEEANARIRAELGMKD